MKEVWKDIKGYEGLYQVSNLGRVKSLERYVIRKNNKGRQLIHKKILVSCVNTHGYMSLSLSKNNKGVNHRVHRLVATAFIPKVDNKNIINHKNGIKTDNNVNNIEWASYSDNLLHAYKTGLNGQNRKVKVIIIENREEHLFNSMKDASLFMGEGKWYVSYYNKYHNANMNKKYRWELV